VSLYQGCPTLLAFSREGGDFESKSIPKGGPFKRDFRLSGAFYRCTENGGWPIQARLSLEWGSSTAAQKNSRLFLYQAGMAGDALPLVAILHPCVGEASHVVVRFSLIGACRVISASNDGSISEEIYFHALNVD
jgi:hypothetical protein